MTPRPLRIGVDATTWANDRGFGRFTRELVTVMVERDAGLHYTLLFDQEPALSLPAGVDVRYASTRRSLGESATGSNTRSAAWFWRLGRAAASGDFDVFFFPAVYSYFPILSRVPCVVCYHDATAERFGHLLFPTRTNRWLWNAKTALARWQTTRAMTVSQSSADDLVTIHGFAPEKVDLVTEGADPCFRKIDDPAVGRRARSRYGIAEDADLLVYVGGMNRHKNVLSLLEAMPEIVEKRPATRLAIVGSTSGEGFWDNVPELQAFVADHPPLAEHVHFTGRIDDEALVELFCGAAALVFPSLWEGFGLPAVEAMSCGVPVLASDRSSLPEVVADAGRFFDPEDPAAIARCVVDFLGDDALRADLATRALRRSGDFSWEAAAELAEASLRRCHEDAS